MFAVRVGAYKAHYWTWTHKHYQFCPGQFVLNVTTPNQVNKQKAMIVIFELSKIVYEDRRPKLNLITSYCISSQPYTRPF